MIPSNIIEEFLTDLEVNTAQAIFALGAGIATIGMYFVFINQYFADRVGSKMKEDVGVHLLWYGFCLANVDFVYYFCNVRDFSVFTISIFQFRYLDDLH